MLFLVFALLIAFGRDYSHSQETLEEKAGSCSSNFVVGALWTHFFEPNATPLLHCNFEATPFSRYSLSTTSDFHDGLCKQSEPILEMFSVQTHGKGTCSILCKLWRTLDEGSRRLRLQLRSQAPFELTKKAEKKTGLAQSQKRLGRSMAAPRTEESAEPKEKGQGERKRHSSKGKSLRPTCTISRRAVEAAITAFYCSTSYIDFIGYTNYGSHTIAAIDQHPQEEQGGLAARNTSYGTEGPSRRFKVADPANACCSCKSWKKQEDTARPRTCSKPITPVMAQILGGSHCPLAEVCCRLPRARQSIWREDRGSQECFGGEQGIFPSRSEYHRHARGCRGDLRRRDYRASAKDRGVHGQIDSHPSGIERRCGRGDSPAGHQKSPNREGSRWTRWAAFSAGRQVSCTPITCQCPLALHWTHSIVHAPDFLTTWEAIDDAFYKTQWFGPVPEHASGIAHVSSYFNPVPFVNAVASTRPSQNRTSKKVRFSKVDAIRLITDSRILDYVIPNGLLSLWEEKPWRLNDYHDEFSDGLALMQTNAITAQYQVPSACEWPTVIIADDVKALVSGPHQETDSRLFYSYGLHETSVGMRSFTLQEVDIHALTEQIQKTWHDFQDSEFRVHLVKPQPRDRVPGTHVIVEFIKQEEPHESIVPSLDETIVWSAFGQSDIERHAHYHQRRLRHADIVSSFLDLCHRAQFTCVARVLGRILRPSWTREIEPGAFVQLHVFPPRFHEPGEFTDYIYGLPSFLADSLELMNEAFLPTLFWRMHLLIDEGYQGVAESEIPIMNFASASAMADRAFDHWHLQLPAALSYAGLHRPGEAEDAIQHFMSY